MAKAVGGVHQCESRSVGGMEVNVLLKLRFSMSGTACGLFLIFMIVVPVACWLFPDTLHTSIINYSYFRILIKIQLL